MNSRAVTLLKWLLWSLLPLAFVEMVRLANGAPLDLAGLLLPWVFILGVFILAWLGLFALSRPLRFLPASLWLAVFILAPLFWILAMLKSGAAWAGWAQLALLYALSLILGTIFSKKGPLTFRDRLVQTAIWAALALAAGLTSAALAQVEAHFADEEFFVALQALALVIFGFLLLLAWQGIQKATLPGIKELPRFPLTHYPLLAFLLVTVAIATILEYQGSFYPQQAPPYEGIRETSPFLCSTTSPDPQTYSGADVQSRMLGIIQASPQKGTPEFGLLALTTGDERWKKAFHDGLLDEALRMRYTGPANSVKSVQFDAALRAYFYIKVRQAYPDLFSSKEQQEVLSWLQAVNRRSTQVEWVDWLYALAFKKSPQGPYENQENGAGLLAWLEDQNLGDPALSASNQAYLDDNPRGWQARFRNTDDAILYQPEWIYNAYLQYLYTSKANPNYLELSFQWLMLQMLPDGAPPRYNHPSYTQAVGPAYLAAQLLQDGQYLWLAGRALDGVQADHIPITARPGMEVALPGSGSSPAAGTCLMYGDSGLPNQSGPLAPDKIVFRDGWSKDSTYLLLNLRFTGWHRYKATGTASLLYQDGPLFSELLSGKTFDWLPTGRSLFRDKRIPRENLNGLVVERTGIGEPLYTLTGVSGPWAQDPPYYARVEKFTTSAEVDSSTIVVDDWRGWQHRRQVYFYHNGPVVFIDQAQGPDSQVAALIWHLNGDGELKDGRITLRSGSQPAEAYFLPGSMDQIQVSPETDQDGNPGRMVEIKGKGEISTVSVFLTGQWAGAQVSVSGTGSQRMLVISKGDKKIEIGY